MLIQPDITLDFQPKYFFVYSQIHFFYKVAVVFCFVEENVEYSHCVVFVFWKLFDGEVAEGVMEIR